VVLKRQIAQLAEWVREGISPGALAENGAIAGVGSVLHAVDKPWSALLR
jgi:hypothetical protein